MTNLRMIVLVPLVWLVAGVVMAEPTGVAGDGTRLGSNGAGPSGSMPPRTGGRPAGPHEAVHWGLAYTPGWALMTQQERLEHRDRMRSMKSYDDCRIYHEQHHALMAERAKERGAGLPQLRRDPCAGLKR